jgi:hypothetical protein
MDVPCRHAGLILALLLLLPTACSFDVKYPDGYTGDILLEDLLDVSRVGTLDTADNREVAGLDSSQRDLEPEFSREVISWCGDGSCDLDSEEDCDTCPADCGCTECGKTCEGAVCIFTACDGVECGDDGCGGTCGSCDIYHECQAGSCVSAPWCGDGTCGPAENCVS